MSGRPYVETLVFIGGIAADIRAWVPEQPDADNEVVWGLEGRLSPGGRAASAAVGAVKLGRRFVDLAGCVGDDLLGESIVNSIQEAGVSVRLVDRIAGVPTGMQQVVIDSKGNKHMVGVASANSQFGDTQLRKADSTIFGADLLYANLEVPLPVVKRVVTTAAQRNVPVMLDATPLPTPFGEEVLEKSLLSHVDVLLTNWSSARRLVGIPASSGPVALELAKGLLRLGPKAVVITMEEHGAMVAIRGKHALVEACKARVVDSSGAGDAFAAGLAVGLTNQARGGWRWEQLLQATRFASASAGVTMTRSGGQDALATREEVERMLASGMQK